MVLSELDSKKAVIKTLKELANENPNLSLSICKRYSMVIDFLFAIQDEMPTVKSKIQINYICENLKYLQEVYGDKFVRLEI